MLFHTWPFLIFMLIVLPGFYALRTTRFWLPWLLAASYFFYGWWNPWYLILVAYSTVLDYLLVALMDHCPPGVSGADLYARDPVLRRAFQASAALLALLLAGALAGPETLRPSALSRPVALAWSRMRTPAACSSAGPCTWAKRIGFLAQSETTGAKPPA